jgi:oxaloacetate decarboxylase alpha subunit/acetyl-CoA carboxylase biotin carboxyl carrier protein
VEVSLTEVFWHTRFQQAKVICRLRVALDANCPAPESFSQPKQATVDLKEIRQIVTLMNEHGLSLFHLEKKDFNIKLKKGTDLEALKEMMSMMPAAAPAAAAPAAVAPAPAAEAAAPVQEGEAVTSPMVGTFYSKPSPDEEAFVSVGSKVSEGQTLCIIEAMKVMNEIKAEKGGTISEVCVEEGAPVQYGDDLFRIK